MSYEQYNLCTIYSAFSWTDKFLMFQVSDLRYFRMRRFCILMSMDRHTDIVQCISTTISLTYKKKKKCMTLLRRHLSNKKPS